MPESVDGWRTAMQMGELREEVYVSRAPVPNHAAGGQDDDGALLNIQLERIEDRYTYKRTRCTTGNYK